VLAAVVKTPDAEVDEYLQVRAEIPEASGGGFTDPPQRVGDCPDGEDNRILDLDARLTVMVGRTARGRATRGA
jgi:hypothetical protein